MNFIFVNQHHKIGRIVSKYLNLGFIYAQICFGRPLFKDTFWDQILKFKTISKMFEGRFLDFAIHYLKFKISCLNYI